MCVRGEGQPLLPTFMGEGVLPPGDYPLTLDERALSFLVDVPAPRPLWDAAWRRHLVENLGVLARQLWQVGIDTLYKVEERARHFARESRADWANFSAWCTMHHRTALPALPETVVLYLSDRAENPQDRYPAAPPNRYRPGPQAADLETPTIFVM